MKKYCWLFEDLLKILFQNILFSKKFLSCSGCFMLFTKIKKESATSFFSTFSAWFFHKSVPYLILYLWTNDIYLWTLFMDDDTINFKTYCQSSSKAKANRQNRRGNKNIWISREQKELFRWNKKYLPQFLKGYLLVRKWEIVGKIFKLVF